MDGGTRHSIGEEARRISPGGDTVPPYGHAFAAAL
ncbi:hypothetical protein QFZ74_000785 [Streptomyces sp. V3I7]|nr:hypothetical protein [Streptomyces sp. V3I7]